MVIFRDVQNTELYKEDQKNHLQPHDPEAMTVNHLVYFLLVLTLSLCVDMVSFSGYIYSYTELGLHCFWPDSAT